MFDLKKIQEEVEQFWEKEKINGKLDKGTGKDRYFLLDGPPYANGVPHVGHIKNTVFKDLYIRLNMMKGKKVLFRPGFDTHGLPVENMVEKKLGLQSKKDIEKYGVINFLRECKDNAALNKDVWMRVYKKIGSVYAGKDPYLTYENYYIESGWWTFKKMWEKRLIYEGEKPVMWCPHCQTSLSGYEVTDSYKDVKDPGIYVLFRLKNSDESLLVYTTTPWTLPGNTAVAIAPGEDYVTIELNGKKIIIAEKRLEKLSEIGFGYRILKTFKGEKLVGKKYEPLLDVPIQKELEKGKMGKAHEVIASIPLLKERVASKMRTKKHIEGGDLFEEFVTVADGTGLVHTAPGHGKTDFMVGQHYKLACVSPVDEECNLTKESGFSGFVKKADKDILERLEREEKLLYQKEITHSYPLCWRCKSPLIFRLSKQLFLEIGKIKKNMLKENEKVKWMPAFARERFENWVENADDWNISRQRYWGIPIPLWECECGNKKVVESKLELENLTKRKINDLHAAGDLTVQCEKCKKAMKKFKGILDVWFDSGIAPWASMGYPNENKEVFEKHFPVDRINEAQDQIRGWFYSLMSCSAAVFEKAPYKEVSMIGWVLDKNGDKMSKSLGNIIGGEEAVDLLGADILRYYFCWDVSPYELQKFNIEIAKKEIGKIFMILWNLQNLSSREEVEEEVEEKWILSRLNNVIKRYQENIEDYETNTAMKEISEFILNDLSRKYVQMTREKEGSVVGKVLPTVLKLLAPVAPFITEKIWQNLKEKGIVNEESVHLASWPEYDKKKINEKLEKDFELAYKIIELGLAERDKAKIGLRWPIVETKIYTNEKLNKEIKEIISRQLNSKKIEQVNSEFLRVEIDIKMTPELEAEGFAREIARKIQSERKEMGLKKSDLIVLNISTDNMLREMLEKNIDFLKKRTGASKIQFCVDESSKKLKNFDVRGKKVSIHLE